MRDALDQIVRHNVKLVAKYYSLVLKVDFNKTFVVNFITIRCILAFGAPMNWEMHQILNGELEMIIYMDQLGGFI